MVVYYDNTDVRTANPVIKAIVLDLKRLSTDETEHEFDIDGLTFIIRFMFDRKDVVVSGGEPDERIWERIEDYITIHSVHVYDDNGDEQETYYDNYCRDIEKLYNNTIKLFT